MARNARAIGWAVPVKLRRTEDRLDQDWLSSPFTAGILLIIMMMVGLMMTACSPPVEGVVVGKDVDPGRTETYWTSEQQACGTERYTTTSTVNGKTTTTQKSRTKYCSQRVIRTRNVPPSWDLIIRPDGAKEGETRFVPVSESVYRRTAIGDRVNTGDPERVNQGPVR